MGLKSVRLLIHVYPNSNPGGLPRRCVAPLAPLTLPEDQEVTVTIEPAFQKSAEDVLALAAAVYQGLPSEVVADIESIALDRRSFFREPA